MALLELNELTRRFGGLVAVDHVSMQVEEGEVRAVIGPNGAGKSTLFNLITGVLKPSRGCISFAGEDIAGLSAPRICQRGIARTFQLTALFPKMTVRENARLAAQAREPRRWQFYGGSSVFSAAGRRADMALARLGLSAVADRPAGLLSHGDQRLLEVAMALSQAPRLLLLDEPTQGLSVEETGQAVEVRFPWAVARLRPSAVRVRIRSRSTSATPPNTASIKRPVLVPVSAHGSASDRNCAYPSAIRLTRCCSPRRARSPRLSQQLNAAEARTPARLPIPTGSWAP